jgi:hypothetical protein
MPDDFPMITLKKMAQGAAFLALVFSQLESASAICARVVIQIEQELTLEREGFEARLGVVNGLPSALDDFEVTLKFSNANGEPVGAYTSGNGASSDKFFYRVQAGSSIPQSIAAGAEQKIAYLIVPTPGSSGTTAKGELYYVGALIKYKVGGEEQIVEVAPDYITVRPMPSLQLQYFLPGDVHGDDPMTEPVEPITPFSLGVRVSNHSPYASARKVKIDSGQPEIIENEQGLLIDFRIIGCEVNGAPAQPTLLANFGDIGPRRSSMGHWLMTSSLSGKFVKFTADVAHAPEFGGALTSLIPEDAISTHRLLGQVKVDLSGRDSVLDFLATDQMTGEYSTVKLYESDNDEISLPVDYYAPGNSLVTLTSSGQGSASLAVSATSAMMYVRATSPIAADKAVRVVRSDGKVLPKSNGWISKAKNASGSWVYWVNVFDTNKELAQTYTLIFTDPPQDNRPPVLTLPGGSSYSIAVGSPLVISATATDPDGTIPGFTTGALPDGAALNDARNGTARLEWTPALTQIGAYAVQIKATDGRLADSRTVSILVTNIVAGFASWQNTYWPGVTDLAIIGPHADPDGDQIENLLEYALNADPTVINENILPTISVEKIAGLSYLTLTYQCRTDDTSLVFEVVASENAYAPLLIWSVQTQTLPVDQAGVPAGMQRVKVRDSQPIETSAPHRYLRLRVTKSATP